MQTISENTPVAMLTVGQLRDFLGLSEPREVKEDQQQPKQERRLLYGLSGIRNLFNVSHTTAQRYKNTFLSEAVIQQGRKIIVDKEKALKLFAEHYKENNV